MVETRLQRQQHEQARSTAYLLRDLPGRPGNTQQSIKALARNASGGRGWRATGRGRGPPLQEQLGHVPVLTRATGVDGSPTHEVGIPTTVCTSVTIISPHQVDDEQRADDNQRGANDEQPSSRSSSGQTSQSRSGRGKRPFP
jgi:hypothetical protein